MTTDAGRQPGQETDAGAGDLPQDPTAYRPLPVTATRDLPVGTEIGPIVKRTSLDKSRLYQGWPAVRNRHTDYAAAQASGLREPNLMGGQAAEYLGELFMKFFGVGYLGGTLTVNYLGFVTPGEEVSARGIVTGRQEEGDRVRLLIDLWVENERGDRVVAGRASGFAS